MPPRLHALAYDVVVNNVTPEPDRLQALRSRLAEDPIDLEVIGGLRDLGDDALVDEVVQLYVEDAPPRLVAIRDAIAAGDAAEVARAAHGLKSSSGNVGARHVRDLCAELETMGRAGSLDSAAAALELLNSEYRRAEGALQSLRD